MSALVKPNTLSLEVTETWIGLVLVGLPTPHASVSEGRVPSNVREIVLETVFAFPAASVATLSGTLTLKRPSAEGVSLNVQTDGPPTNALMEAFETPRSA